MRALLSYALLGLACSLLISCDREPEDNPAPTDTAPTSLRIAWFADDADSVGPVSLWLDDRPLIDSVREYWLSPRAVRAGHQHHVTVTAWDPNRTSIWWDVFTLPTAAGCTYAITRARGQYAGYVIPDSSFAPDTLSCVIRLVNLHPVQEMKLSCEYIRLIEYSCSAASGDICFYKSVSAGARHEGELYDLKVFPHPPLAGTVAVHPPLSQFQPGRVYSVYTLADAGHSPSSPGFDVRVIQDYPVPPTP